MRYAFVMQPTDHPDVNQLLEHLLAQMQDILGPKLVGLYLFGSLTTGDFDPGISDVDLLAAVTETINQAEFDALNTMQNEAVKNQPEWDNRIEIAYLSLHALKTFKTEESLIAIISPGEPFHFKEAGKDWLVNWYMVREKGVTLFGPPPQTIIDSITQDEFVQTVKEHMLWWRDYIYEVRERGTQAYAILTMCRALYTHQHGEQVSKVKAAAWAAQALPDWSGLIRQAVEWRRTSRTDSVDHNATLPETRRFVNYVIGQILGANG